MMYGPGLVTLLGGEARETAGDKPELSMELSPRAAITNLFAGRARGHVTLTHGLVSTAKAIWKTIRGTTHCSRPRSAFVLRHPPAPIIRAIARRRRTRRGTSGRGPLGVLGITIGGLAGYYGGWVDVVVQRIIEVLQSIPSIPLWLALAAILPVTWSPLLVYFGITVILGLLDWTGLARAVRSKLLSLREEDYVLASQLLGAKPRRIIMRHLIPGFMSHLIASATITIPAMILGETSLSFLGLGLRPPITSWGVLLNEAQNINVIVLYPWLLLPVVPVILVILAYNFMGDGLRDAADPYH